MRRKVGGNVALVIKDKPMTLARLRASAIYRLGAVPRGESLAETYVEPAVATVDDELTDLTAAVMGRLEQQDQAIAEIRAANARIDAAIEALAGAIRVGCDHVADAAEAVTRPDPPPSA